MKQQLRLFYFLVFFSVIFSSAYAQVKRTNLIILNDGSEYHGKLIRIDEKRIIFETLDGEKTFDKTLVYMVTFLQNRQYEDVTDISEVEDEEIKENFRFSQNYLASQEENLVYLLDRVTYEYDGTHIIQYGKVIFKIFNDAGKEQTIRTISYPADVGSCELLYAIAVTPEGKVISVREDAINDEPINNSYRLYNRNRRIKFSLPNPEIGNFFAFEYRKILPLDPVHYPIYDRFYLRTDDPMVKKERIYKNMPFKLKYKFHAGEVFCRRPRIKFSSGVLKITAENIEKIVIDENDTPQTSYFIPNLLIYTDLTKEEATSLYYNFYFKRKSEKVSPELQKLIKENKWENLRTSEKIKEIYYWIQRNVVSVGLGPSFQHYKIHDEDAVLSERKLTSLDKVHLFIKILSASQIQGDLIFYHGPDRAKSPVKSFLPYFYDKVACKVNLEGKVYYLSFDDTNLQFGEMPDGSSGGVGISWGENAAEWVRLPEIDSQQNGTEVNYICTLKEDGTLLINRKQICWGRESDEYRKLRFLSDLEKEKYFKKSVSSIKVGSELLHYQIDSDLANSETPVVLSDSMKVKDYTVKSGEMHILKLPEFQYGNPAAALEKRKFSLYFDSYSSLIRHYTISLPENFVVKHLPQSVHFSFKKDAFQISYYFDSASRTLQVSVSSAFGNTFVTPKEYSKFRKFVDQCSKQSKQVIILERSE